MTYAFPQWLLDMTPKDGEYHNVRFERRPDGVERAWIDDVEVTPPKPAEEPSIFACPDFAISISKRGA